VLIRHVKGSDYRLDVAKRSVLKVVSWRMLNGIDYLTPVLVEEELKLNTVFSFGHTDKNGHAIAYFRLSNSALPDPWALVRATALIIEKCVRVSGKKGLNQVTWIVDIEPLSYSTVPPYAVLKEIAHMFTHYYPERLYHLFIAFAPWYFRAVWNVVSSFLTENTKGKIEVLAWEDSKKYKSFSQLIEKDMLLTKFGGTLELEYTFDLEVEQFKEIIGQKGQVSSLDSGGVVVK